MLEGCAELDIFLEIVLLTIFILAFAVRNMRHIL